MLKRFQTILVTVTLLTLFPLSGCVGSSSSPQQNEEMLSRMNALEQRLQALEMRTSALEQQHREDIDALKSDLKNILEYLHISLDNLTRAGNLEKELGDLEESAARAIKEKLQELLDLSQEMIDKLERELEQPNQQ